MPAELKADGSPCIRCGAIEAAQMHPEGMICIEKEECAARVFAQRSFFDPNPRALVPDQILGTREGWNWCPVCQGIKPPEHGHGIELCAPGGACRFSGPLIDLSARVEVAESLLCAIAFDAQRLVIDVRHGEGCDPGDPDRGCIFCEAAR